MGADSCTLVPIVDGATLHHLVKRIDVGGRNVAQFLIKLLRVRGISGLNRTSDFGFAREFVEQHCYVAADPQVERKLAEDTTIVDLEVALPTKSKAWIGLPRFWAPECLFNMTLLDVSGPGLSLSLWALINSIDVSHRNRLVRNIVPCGGLSMLPGLSTRLLRDLKLAEATIRAPTRLDEKSNSVPRTEMPFRIEDAPLRKNLSFYGAAFLAHAMRDKETFWAHKGDWEERGKDWCLQRISGLA